MSERLQKFLARSGLGSRRSCEQLIKSNKVFVNGKIAKLGSSVNKDDVVEYEGKTLSFIKSEIKLLILNKQKECFLRQREKKIYQLCLIFFQNQSRGLDGYQ